MAILILLLWKTNLSRSYVTLTPELWHYTEQHSMLSKNPLSVVSHFMTNIWAGNAGVWWQHSKSSHATPIHPVPFTLFPLSFLFFFFKAELKSMRKPQCGVSSLELELHPRLKTLKPSSLWLLISKPICQRRLHLNISTWQRQMPHRLSVWNLSLLSVALVIRGGHTAALQRDVMCLFYSGGVSTRLIG